jgi:hypothetical protein
MIEVRPRGPNQPEKRFVENCKPAPIIEIDIGREFVV